MIDNCWPSLPYYHDKIEDILSNLITSIQQIFENSLDPFRVGKLCGEYRNGEDHCYTVYVFALLFGTEDAKLTNLFIKSVDLSL
jgi:hypothetical protein